MATTIQDYAKSKKIRLHQAKAAVKAVFGEVLETLTDDDIKRVENAGRETAIEEGLEAGTLSLPPTVEVNHIEYQTPEKTRIKLQGILDEELKYFRPSQKSFTAIALACYEEYNVRLAKQTVERTVERVVETLYGVEQQAIQPIIQDYEQKFYQLEQDEKQAQARRSQQVKNRLSEVDTLLLDLAKVGIDIKS